MTKLVATALLTGFAFAQSESPGRLEFEVASIKPDRINSPTTFGVGEGKRIDVNVTLKILIGLAYRLQEFQITGGPGWAGSDRFDIEGKAADLKASPDQLRLMLQSLLEDRFKLKFHRETKEAPVFALAVARNGPKIELSSDQESPPVNGPAPPGAGPNHGAIRTGSGSLVGNAVTLSLFIKMLSQRLGRPVIDQTNLTGRYDIQLHWAPGIGETPYGPAGYILPREDSSGPSISTAIQEQLGLRLISAKGPVEFFVIDQVEQPSGN